MVSTPSDVTRFTGEERRRLLQECLHQRGRAYHAPAARPISAWQPPTEILALRENYQELEKAFGNIYFACSEGVNAATATVGGRQFVNFCSYNYLGMSGARAVSQATKDAIDRYGTSVSASRLTSGERPVHRELEAALANLLGTDDCLVFVGGYTTNVTVVSHLCGAGDLILYDSLIHASVQGGARQSSAEVRPFPHNDWRALDTMLAQQRHYYRQVLIVIEGIYSMDGDIPDLPRFIDVKRRHGVLLMIDEAHSIGVLGAHGAGIGEHFGVDRKDVDIWMGTLSKSFASCGGYVAASQLLIEYLRCTAPGFVYSAGMSPANAAAALAAIHLLAAEPDRVQTLQQRAALFLDLVQSRGLNTGASPGSAVISIVLGQPLRCGRMYRLLHERGIYVLPIIYPAVPENGARLRVFISAMHSEAQILTTANALTECLPRCG